MRSAVRGEIPAGGALRKIKLVLEYLGTRYAGWQVQANADTVQARVEEALGRVLREPVRIHGAGRTDAGVHARGQVAHFATPNPLPLRNIREGTNTYLPPDIAVLRAEEVPRSFHARYDARGKVYRYLVFRREVPSPFWRHRAAHVPFPLRRKKMAAAADLLKGTHDFTAFAAAGRPVRDGVRNISRIAISAQGFLLRFEFHGDGFLYKMVRNIVGTLLEVGNGRIEPARVSEILASGDRTLAGPTAPPGGLYLVEVLYGAATPAASAGRENIYP